MSEENLIEKNTGKKLTIADIADALGVSKTTVSRSISGKGRIGANTKQRVLDYIEEYGYQPNMVAKGLAQSKTYNICVACPSDYNVGDLIFFQHCLMGITKKAAEMEYDIVIAMVKNEDISQLERIVRNHKADGVILMRTMIEDTSIAFLQNNELPFVAIGNAAPDVVQVDNDNRSACKSMTELLLNQGMKRLALIGGDTSHMVTRSRYAGYEDAFRELGIPMEEDLVFLNADRDGNLSKDVEAAMAKKPDCIVCIDDTVCVGVLSKFRDAGIRVPEDMRVASFYHNAQLDYHEPPITTLKFDATLLGATACSCLISHLRDGEPLEGHIILDYELLQRGSTVDYIKKTK